MAAGSNRLDRLLARTLQYPIKRVRLDIAQGKVRLDDDCCRDPSRLVHRFSLITYQGRVIQAQSPVYIMLHKPVGVVCATRDEQHQTVLDLIDHPQKHELHIVGRLDLNSSGLVLLTNDGRWSSALTDPQHKVPKVYEVRVENPLTPDYVSDFANGMYFAYEDITTASAELTLTSTYTARVVLTEGKYHQIKRMFGRFRNPVLALHRVAIGDHVLPAQLAAGEWSVLSLTS
ncbi:MAG: 16S rRNA pseudouridine(516) synthase [Bacterioplanes sp.]|nr:16S rRNA pseudouridine(516) synthase [Bacterioplanes sp.]